MKKNTQTKHFFFCAFSDLASVIRHVTCTEEGETRLYLADRVIHLQFRQEAILVNGKSMQGDSLILTDPGHNEKVLFYRQGPVPALPPSGRIRLDPEVPVTVGSDYENMICYQFHSKVKGTHLVLDMEGEHGVLHNLGREGVYRNGEPVKDSAVLEKGDLLQLYGLTMRFLPPCLVYVPHIGECRVVDRGLQGMELGGRPTAVLQRSLCKTSLPLLPLEEQERELLCPPYKAEVSQTPWLLSVGPSVTMIFPILVMSLLGSRMGNGAGGGYLYITLAAGICSSLLGVFWGLTNRMVARGEERRSNRERIVQYREYLRRFEEEFQKLAEEEFRLLHKRYPAAQDYFAENMVLHMGWNRYVEDTDFWFTRLGSGRQMFPVKLKLQEGRKDLQPDMLEEEAATLQEKYRYLEQVPVGVDFRENAWLLINGETEHIRDGVLQIFWQQVLHHPPEEMRVVCFFDHAIPWQSILYQNMKWAPHVWAENGETRFLAGDRDAASEILPDLTRALSKEKKEAFFLIFLLEPEWIRGEVLWNFIKEDHSGRVAVVGLKNKADELGKEFRNRMIWFEDRQELQLYTGERGECIPVRYDSFDLKRSLAYSRNLVLCKRSGDGKNQGVPKKVDFLELFQCGRSEELHCERRWQEARPEKRLKAAIGKGMHGALVYLDVHEKFHGPHGLIAGTTGSGKSELLQTYLLSLAVQFSPQDVNFFVIDYKGGGTGNTVRKLPHCAGVISNLSGNQIHRAMLAISSENKRRQQLLSQYEVNHIDAYMNLYREGKTSAPLPHLLIVIDEFAELKKEEPEFMLEVISLAQVGRSLGVHLILATQKPAGTVDDKIWSNARFHLCLRVQDKQDSQDMLHKPDAAFLTEPGQCYLQIGNDELYERFQTAYCGGRYQPGRKKKEEVVLISETGRRRSVYREEKAGSGEMLMDHIISYVNQTADHYGYERAGLLWLPELEEEIFLEDTQENIQPSVFRIGKYDDPENQCQETLFYEPTKEGHLGICGGPATGKSHFIKLILEQIIRQYTPWQAEYFLLVMEQPGYGKYEELQHCLGLVQTPGDTSVFFYQLQQLWMERKRLLNGENYMTFIRENPGKLPILYGIIDGIGTLRKTLREGEEEFLLTMAAEGISLGLFLIVTGSGVTDFPSKLWNKIRTTLSFELSDSYQYGDVLRQYQGIRTPKSGVAGRGLCRKEKRILEFQAFAFSKMPEGCREGSPFYDRIIRIPEYPEQKELLKNYKKSKSFQAGSSRIPLGYNRETGFIEELELQKIAGCLISGADQTGKSNLVYGILTSTLRLTNWKVVLLDTENEYAELAGRKEVLYYPERERMEASQIREWIKEERILLVIPHLAEFIREIYSGGQERRSEAQQWEELVCKRKDTFAVIGAYQPQRDMEVYSSTFFRSLAAGQCGIHLGGNAQAQRALEFEGLSFTVLNRSERAGHGFYKKGTGTDTIRLMVPWNERKVGYDDTGGSVCTDVE